MERVDNLTTKKKINKQEVIIHNTLRLAKWFGWNYYDVMDIPLPAYIESLKFAEEESRKDKEALEKEKKKKSKRF